MDFGQLYAGLNALDVAMVKRNPDGTFAGLKEGSETLGIPTVKVNPVTGGIENLNFGYDYPLPSISINRYLSGKNLAKAMRDAVADQVEYASTREGRCSAISIPSGDYDCDGTTVEIPPFMKIELLGNSVLRANDSNNPIFWVRNDLSGYAFSQDIDSIYNNRVFDGSKGSLVIRGNRSAGSVALRVGNGDGVMGAAYAGPADHITALCEFHGLRSLLMDNALEFTNNNNFCNRFYGFRATSNNKGLVTSTGSAVNAFESSTFHDCFFNNQVQSNMEFNSAHQVLLNGTSLTFCANGNVEFNSDFVRFMMQGGRVENGPYVTKSNGAYTRSIAQFVNSWLVPTWSGNANPVTHLRKLFQGQHIIVLDDVVFDLNGAIPHNTAYADPAKYVLSDSTTTMHVGQIRANHYPSSTMKPQPIPHPNSNLLANGSFSSDIAGWTKLGIGGTIAYSTAESYSASGSLIASISSGQIRIESEHVAVESGRFYYGDALIKALSTPAIVGGIINFRINWYKADNTTLLSSSAYSSGGYTSLANNWVRSCSGTGLVQAPVGARFASIEIATNAGTTMNFHIDDAYFVRLG